MWPQETETDTTKDACGNIPNSVIGKSPRLETVPTSHHSRVDGQTPRGQSTRGMVRSNETDMLYTHQHGVLVVPFGFL